MCATHESCVSVLNLLLGQPGKVMSSPSNIVILHHHSWELYGELGGGGQADAHWDSSLMFIHTKK